MLGLFIKTIFNTCIMFGLIALVVYMVYEGEKQDELMQRTPINQPAQMNAVKQKENDEMTDYMYNVWLPATVVITQ